MSQNRHRPRYHFLPPTNWMNDPNGLIQWRGRYHMFYQHNPFAAVWGNMSWGHAVSDDLVHWHDLPIALRPDSEGVDTDGCFSGIAVNNNGVATIVYTGVVEPAQLACIATSTDDDLIHWQKHPNNPVIKSTPPDLDLVAYRDHSVWREDGMWYQVVGAGIKGVGGAALLYRSHDLVDWEYLHPLCVGDVNQRDPVWTGTMWECPLFLDLGEKHALLISAWDHATFYTVCMVGTYANKRFTPELTYKIDLGDNFFYAPQAMRDDQGRWLMWGWLQEGRSQEAQVADGWSGVMSLPRVVTLRPDGRLGLAPAPELKTLRQAPKQFHSRSIAPGQRNLLDGLQGDCIELIAEIEVGDAEQCGLRLRCSPDGSEETLLYYDRNAGQLVLDTSKSSSDPSTERTNRSGPYRPAAGEPIRIQLFIDRSCIEAYVDGWCCLTGRIYPAHEESLGIDLFSQGGTATLRHLTAWPLNDIGRP